MSVTLNSLGRYQLNRVLGHGAMGMVYEGLDPLLNRQVAIKTILRSNLVDAESLADSSARFIREAQAIARLNHPHIVTVFDFGEEGEVAYIVMEFVRGRELKSYLDEGECFDLPESVRIMRELLDALNFAHKQGVVHRDVKPANVMLDADRRVKLTDFGVARLADSNSDRTQAGTMVGTPSYMSPEQIQGLPVGSRADIFAAGIILYQFLTGKKPFPGPGQWTIQKQIVSDDPVWPSLVDSRIPAVFDGIVRRALAKDPAQRFATAAEFSAELERTLPQGMVYASDGTTLVVEDKPVPSKAAKDDEAPTLKVVPEANENSRDNTAAATIQPIEAEALAPARQVTQTVAVRKPGRRAFRLIGASLLLALAGGVAYFATSARQPVEVPTLAPVSASAPSGAAVASRTEVPPVAAEQPAKAESPAPAALPAPQASPVVPAEPPKRVVAATRVAKADGLSRARAPAAREPANPRCGDLLQRFQLGDVLSPDDLAVLQKECRK